MELTDKTIIITGAASGIGKASAFACLQAGANVVLNDIEGDKLAATTTEFAAANLDGEALGVEADIRDGDQVVGLFDQTVERFGRIDGILANAGITGTRKPIAELDFDSWDEVMNVNLNGTFRVVMEGSRRLLAQGEGGSIIISGSSQGIRPLPGFIAYAASKGALHNLAQSLAFELA